jgi:hypothetical protein
MAQLRISDALIINFFVYIYKTILNIMFQTIIACYVHYNGNLDTKTNHLTRCTTDNFWQQFAKKHAQHLITLQSLVGIVDKISCCICYINSL